MSILMKSFSDVKFEIFKVILGKEKRNTASRFVIDEMLSESLLITEKFLDSCKEEEEDMEDSEMFQRKYDILCSKEEEFNGNK